MVNFEDITNNGIFPRSKFNLDDWPAYYFALTTTELLAQAQNHGEMEEKYLIKSTEGLGSALYEEYSKGRKDMVDWRQAHSRSREELEKILSALPMPLSEEEYQRIERNDIQKMKKEWNQIKGDARRIGFLIDPIKSFWPEFPYNTEEELAAARKSKLYVRRVYFDTYRVIIEESSQSHVGSGDPL